MLSQIKMKIPRGNYSTSIIDNVEVWTNKNGHAIYVCNHADGTEEYKEFDGDGNVVYTINNRGREMYAEYTPNGWLYSTREVVVGNGERIERHKIYSKRLSVIYFSHSNGVTEWYDLDEKPIAEEMFNRIFYPHAGKIVYPYKYVPSKEYP